MNERALKWIVKIFRSHSVRFIVSGGLAAHAHGSPRAVRDFDFEIEENGFDKIATDVAPYITQPAHRHMSKAFENTLMKLNYNGQDIDIASATNAKIFNAKTGSWQSDYTDLDQYELKKIYGVELPVMRREDVIAYKSKSPRPEDCIDIEALQKLNPATWAGLR